MCVRRGIQALLGMVVGLAWIGGGLAQDLVKSADGSGVVGYKDTPILDWCGFHKHDPDRPFPKVVSPGQEAGIGSLPASDGIVLFDGRDLSAWQPSTWKLVDGTVEAVEGDLVTREAFGDCQLHVEWRAPDPPQGGPMNRGNSGVLFMGLYELQIFDSYTEKIYPDGQAGAIYGETPPLVNACRKPGEWQAFDVVFRAPVFEGETLKSPGRISAFHNGILIHDGVEIHGPVSHRQIAPYRAHPAELSLHLQAHGNPVRFRNIWIRRLGK